MLKIKLKQNDKNIEQSYIFGYSLDIIKGGDEL